MGKAPITASREKGILLPARFSVTSWRVTCPRSSVRSAGAARLGWRRAAPGRCPGSAAAAAGADSRAAAWPDSSQMRPTGTSGVTEFRHGTCRVPVRRRCPSPRARGPGQGRSGAGDRGTFPAPRGPQRGGGKEGGERRARDGALREGGSEGERLAAGALPRGPGRAALRWRKGRPPGAAVTRLRRGGAAPRPRVGAAARPRRGERALSGAARGACGAAEDEQPAPTGQGAAAEVAERAAAGLHRESLGLAVEECPGAAARRSVPAAPRPPLPARGRWGDAPAPVARRGPAPGAPSLLPERGEPAASAGRDGQLPAGRRRAACGRVGLRAGAGQAGRSPRPLQAAPARVPAGSAGCSHTQSGSGLSLPLAPCRRHLLSVSETKRVGFTSGKQAHLLLRSVF